MNRWVSLVLIALAWSALVGVLWSQFGGKPERLWSGIDKDSYVAKKFIYSQLDMNAWGYLTFGITVAACFSLGWVGLAILVGGFLADTYLRTFARSGEGISVVASFCSSAVFVVWLVASRKLPYNVWFTAAAGLFGTLIGFLTDKLAYQGDLNVSHGFAHLGGDLAGYAFGALLWALGLLNL